MKEMIKMDYDRYNQMTEKIMICSDAFRWALPHIEQSIIDAGQKADGIWQLLEVIAQQIEQSVEELREYI